MGAVAAPLGVISAVSSLASIGLGAEAATAKGAGQKAADDYQAQRAEQAAIYAKTQAAQTDAGMRENLNITLDNIDAVRSAAGVDPSSLTTAALRDRSEVLGDRARTTKVDNILAQANQDTSDAAYLRSAGEFALQMGELNAAAGVAGSIAKTDWTKFGFGGGSA